MLAATQPAPRGRRVVILGDMLELGPTELELHAALASHPAMEFADVVHCVGSRAKALWQTLDPLKRGECVASSDALLADLMRLVGAGDVVLVKGSLGSKLRPVVDGLRKLGHSARKVAQ